MFIARCHAHDTNQANGSKERVNAVQDSCWARLHTWWSEDVSSLDGGDVKLSIVVRPRRRMGGLDQFLVTRYSRVDGRHCPLDGWEQRGLACVSSRAVNGTFHSAPTRACWKCLQLLSQLRIFKTLYLKHLNMGNRQEIVHKDPPVSYCGHACINARFE